MTITKKHIGAFALIVGLVTGGAAMTASKIHAQSATNIVPVTTASGDVQTVGDTDNVQDPGGIEKPDSVSEKSASGSQHEQENEANDTDGGANEDAN